MNRIARSVIESCRGRNAQFVFTRDGKPVKKIYNSGWKAARRRAALRYEQEIGRPCPAGFRAIRVHDCIHAYGHRLRGAGVSFEDRKVLLGHKMQDVTTHYSAAEVGVLIAAYDRVCDLSARASPAIAVVRSHPLGAVALRDTRTVDMKIAKRRKEVPLAKLSNSLKELAAEFAEADGVSLEVFIAAAVAEKVSSLRATAGGVFPQLPATHAAIRARRIDEELKASRDDSPGGRYEAAERGADTFDPELEWYNAHNWRRPTITPPKVPRAEIIKKAIFKVSIGRAIKAELLVVSGTAEALIALRRPCFAQARGDLQWSPAQRMRWAPGGCGGNLRRFRSPFFAASPDSPSMSEPARRMRLALFRMLPMAL